MHEATAVTAAVSPAYPLWADVEDGRVKPPAATAEAPVADVETGAVAAVDFEATVADAAAVAAVGVAAADEDGRVKPPEATVADVAAMAAVEATVADVAAEAAVEAPVVDVETAAEPAVDFEAAVAATESNYNLELVRCFD